MDILSRQRRTKTNINPEFRFGVKFVDEFEDPGNEFTVVEVLARTKKKALNYFRKHFHQPDAHVVCVYSPKERKCYAPKIQKTFATDEAKRITDEIFGSNNESSAQSVQ